jgi:hypothetical protein
MITRLRLDKAIGLWLLIVAFCPAINGAAAPGASAFTHHGRLSLDGLPADGDYEFTFALYDSAANGRQIGATLTNLPVTVNNGIFSTVVDFGLAPFGGDQRWLEIGVRPAGAAASFVTLQPRQQLTATPYAAFSLNNPTPEQLMAVSNSLSLAISAQSSTAQSLYVALTNQLSNTLPRNNPVSAGLVLNQKSKADPFPLSIFADGIAGTNNGYSLGNGYISGGSGGLYPVAFMRPTTSGYTMPFDLMPNSTNADVWIDLCSDDLWANNGGAVEFLDLRKRGSSSGGYAEITTRAWGEGKLIQPLLLQGEGGPLVVSGYSGPLPQVTINSARNYWSFDSYFNSKLFVQFRPATNVNVVIDAVDGAALFAAGNDSAASGIPILYQGTSHLFSTDNRQSYGMVFSNNLLTATSVVINRNLAVGGAAATQQAFAVNSTNATSQPWPLMNTAQRDAISLNPPATGSVIFNTDRSQPELIDGNGHWYRLGQRPALGTTTVSNTIVTADVDILLVKGQGQRNVRLPAPNLYTNRIIEIKDASFSASKGQITITSTNGLIENASFIFIQKDGGTIRLISDGSDWFQLN